MGRFFAAVCWIWAFAAVASASEIRTYRFVPDGSLSYQVYCGECALPLLGARADVAGTFRVELDFETGAGWLLELDDRLVNYFNVLSAAELPGGQELVPVQLVNNSGFIPSWVPEFEPPVFGLLTFENDEIVLSSTNVPLGPVVGMHLPPLPLPFKVTMHGNTARFYSHLPIIEWVASVGGAQAVLVPEPAACWLTLFAVVVVAHRRRRCR